MGSPSASRARLHPHWKQKVSIRRPNQRQDWMPSCRRILIKAMYLLRESTFSLCCGVRKRCVAPTTVQCQKTMPPAPKTRLSLRICHRRARYRTARLGVQLWHRTHHGVADRERRWARRHDGWISSVPVAGGRGNETNSYSPSENVCLQCVVARTPYETATLYGLVKKAKWKAALDFYVGSNGFKMPAGGITSELITCTRSVGPSAIGAIGTRAGRSTAAGQILAIHACHQPGTACRGGSAWMPRTTLVSHACTSCGKRRRR